MTETNENPYQSPESDVAQAVENGLDEKTFNHLCQGQKMAIYAIALYFIAGIAANSVGGAIAGILIIIALLLALAGLVRILMGASIGTVSKVLLFIGMFIPVVNLLALARISSIATKELRDNGYKVGFFGVKGGYADAA